MKDTTKSKILALEEVQGGKPRKPTFTLAQAETIQAKAERVKRRKLKGKYRPGLKSNGLSWLTSFQRAVYLAFTDIKRHGLPRTWFTRKIKIPRERL